MSYFSAVVQRHLDAARAGIPPSVPATEQMSPALDDLSLQFALWTRAHRQPGIDIGSGDGVATAAALARGGRVIAVDPDAQVLQRLLARIPSQEYKRVRVRQASLENIDFMFERFCAVHVSRVLHMVDPDARRVAFRKFFRWLYPNGKLFVSALTSVGPYRYRSVHLLDEVVLRRELVAAGFVVEKVDCRPLAWDAAQLCCDVIARCGD